MDTTLEWAFSTTLQWSKFPVTRGLKLGRLRRARWGVEWRLYVL
jgi:hypothetical protein